MREHYPVNTNECGRWLVVVLSLWMHLVRLVLPGRCSAVGIFVGRCFTTDGEPMCFSRRHMPPDVSAFHEYALAVSHHSGIFYSNVRRDSWEFGVSKDRVSRWTKFLEQRGWFRRIDRSKRLKRNPHTGLLESIRYAVIPHEELCSQT